MELSGIGIAANYYKGSLITTGKIYLEDDGLTFKPDKINVSHPTFQIAYSEIRGAEPRKMLFGTVNNGLNIYTKDDKQYKFHTMSAKEIAAFLRTKIQL